MSRKSRATLPSPFRYFNSSPDVIRLVVMMYVRFPLLLLNVENSSVPATVTRTANDRVRLDFLNPRHDKLDVVLPPQTVPWRATVPAGHGLTTKVRSHLA